MNPIPLNDRGQFRYTDLIGYIPEFMKQEPDIVEFLQVFSDYMNNAYRNLDTVQKFDFKLCVPESRLGKTVQRMNSLREMLLVAAGKAAEVVLMSVPRANVKSNGVFSRSATPYRIECPEDSVMESIPQAERLDPSLVAMDDGDVVFVSYPNVQGTPTVTYSVSLPDNGGCTLLRDPMGGSQDPFTGSDNAVDRMVSFHVDDIGSVHTKYGETVNGVRYYEVFFGAKVYDVESVPATVHVDMGADRLLVDYYGMRSGARTDSLGSTQYYAEVGFAGGDGWGWRNGMPTAIIYLRGSNGSGVDMVGSDAVLSPDPVMYPHMDRYLVDMSTSDSGRSLYADATANVSVFDGMVVTLVAGGDHVIGDYTAVAVDGNPKRLKLVPADETSSVAEAGTAGRVTMVACPLYYSRMVGAVDGNPRYDMRPVERGGKLDYESAYKVHGCHSIDSNVYVPRCTFTVGVPGTTMELRGPGATALYTQLMNGSVELYCNDAFWKGIMTVKGVTRSPSGQGYTITHGPVELAAGAGTTSTCDVTVIRTGYVTVYEDGSAELSTLRVAAQDGRKTVTVVLERSDDRMDTHARLLGVSGGQYSLDTDGMAPGVYYVIPVDTENATGSATRVTSMAYSSASGAYSVAYAASSGNMYGCEFYIAFDRRGNRTLAYNMCGVSDFSQETRYDSGTTVYYEGELYRSMAPISGVLPPVSSSWKQVSGEYRYYGRDYSVNPMMPYCGPICPVEYDGRLPYGTVDPSVLTSALYICKAEDHSLKYGWEHREYLNYPTTMNRSDKSRNGYAEFYAGGCNLHDGCWLDASDITNYRPGNQVSWDIRYTVPKRGCSESVTLYLDNERSVLARRDGDAWQVLLKSPAHGLVDGCEIVVDGLPDSDLDINAKYVKVTAIDGDTLTYAIPADPADTRNEVMIPIPDEGVYIRYVGDYRYRITGIPEYSETGILDITVERDAVGIAVGDEVYLDYILPDPAVICIVNAIDLVTGSLRVTVADGTEYDPDAFRLTAGSRIRKKIAENDVVRVGGDLYVVKMGDWEPIGADGLVLPIDLFARNNLFEVMDNNPARALGGVLGVNAIEFIGQDTAHVTLGDGIAHFTPENAEYIEGHTMVYINNAYPSEYGGWHMVKKVYGPQQFDIYMELRNSELTSASPVNSNRMTLRELKWYRYTLNEVEWSRTSNITTYYGRNSVVDLGNGAMRTELPHGFRPGDRIVFGKPESFASRGLEGDVLAEFPSAVVATVISNTEFTVTGMRGTLDSGMGVCRGVVLTGSGNYIRNMVGEYDRVIFDAEGDFTYRFTHHSLVIAGAQYNPTERRVYVVNRDGYWTPVGSKRIMKIRDISVDQYRSETQYDYFDPTRVSPYTFNTYNDVEVGCWNSRYMTVGKDCVDKVNFYAPALDGLDSTRKMSTEYSSAEDYANVAPRHELDRTFHGVPDMKYPLAERIERLCYLRDPNVIDYGLIGYLARFMGYDLTALSDDITESAMYNTQREREQAVRDAISHLPQYYSLGGTEAGIGMLMETFGVIGRAVTLWTSVDRPCDELITEKEVDERVMSDGGTWVPTPYIDLELVHDSRYPQFDCSASDVARIREHIRTFKPINVVFRDVVEKYVGQVDLDASVSMRVTGVSMDFGVISGDGQQVDIDYAPPGMAGSDCSF